MVIDLYRLVGGHLISCGDDYNKAFTKISDCMSIAFS